MDELEGYKINPKPSNYPLSLHSTFIGGAHKFPPLDTSGAVSAASFRK
jgi:hypothetical protein